LVPAADEVVRSGATLVIAMTVGVLAGGLIPFQTAINTRLSVRLGAVLPASLVSFAVGTLGLGIVVLATGTSVPWAVTAAGQPWWIWIGGVCGLVFLTLNIVLMPRLGAAATVILPLLGLVLGGLLIDQTGAFGTARRSLGPAVGLGAVLVVMGAVVVNLAGRPRARAEVPVTGAPVADVPDTRQRAGGAGAGSPGAPPVLWVVGVLTGMLGAVQTAVNGRLGHVMGSGLAAALVSFLVGTVGLTLVCLVTRQRFHVTRGLRPWMFLGGLLGASFIFVNAVNATVLGTALTVSVVLLGQVAAGLALDHFGWIGVHPRPVTVLRISGALLVLAGVALVRFG
jgi:bacterial/archaeal transporter family-2 protein